MRVMRDVTTVKKVALKRAETDGEAEEDSDTASGGNSAFGGKGA
jgi:hypothetical protein